MISKQELRKEIRQTLQQISIEERKNEDEKIYQTLIESEVFKHAKTLFVFVSTDREVNTHPFIKEALRQKKQVCVPKSYDDGIMKAYLIHSFSDLKLGRYQILEPTTDVEVSPKEIDLIIVPCCSASMDGKRLGYGKGYYDRYLSQTDATKLVLCRQALLRSDIPEDPYDQRMDMICTQEGLFLVK